MCKNYNGYEHHPTSKRITQLLEHRPNSIMIAIFYIHYIGTLLGQLPSMIDGDYEALCFGAFGDEASLVDLKVDKDKM